MAIPLAAKPVKLTKEEARNLTLQRQLLFGSKPKKGKRGTLSAIKTLGYVQIDTINVIERAHHLTLHSRIPNYQKQFLHDLQVKDKKIFEYWAHAASFIPMEDYRYYLSYMEKQRSPKRNSWLDTWIKKHGALTVKVRQRIKKEGPLAASDFKDEKGRKRGPWWDWKPAKAALEILFWQGELMVKERRNFQRIYDLTERVLPDDIDISLPTEEEEKEFFIKRALGALGIAAIQDINRYIGTSGKLNPWIEKLEKRQELIPVEVKGSNRSYLMLATTRIPKKKSNSTVVHLLSPFDNAIILRDRIQDLFDFSYCLECYQPREKRKYGYFCLPILWGNRIVGRIDPKADRKNSCLSINNLHIVNRKILKKEFIQEFCISLIDFALFNGCVNIVIADSIDAKIRKIISKNLGM